MLFVMIDKLVLVLCFQFPISLIHGGFLHFKQNINLTLQTCNFSKSFRLYKDASLQECVVDCHLRSSCKFAIYRHTIGICGLVDFEIDTSTLTDVFPLCAYTQPSQWIFSNLGQCTVNGCVDRQMCNSDAVAGTQTCVISECQAPPSIDKARFRPQKREIGSRIAYFCINGYTARGNSTVICQEDGTWSSTSFMCSKMCPRPLLVDNADIVNISTRDYGYGAVLSIECKAGFISHKSTNITSECKTDSNWSEKLIPCCREGYKYSWHSKGKSCYKIHEDETLESREEMAEYCKNESSTSSLFFDGNIQHKLELTENILNTDNSTLDYIITSKKKSDMKTDLLKCIGKSEVKISEHDKQRKNNVEMLLNTRYPEFNTTALSYDTLIMTLQNRSVELKADHEIFRYNDAISRLNLTSSFSLSSNASYEELYIELENKTINKNDFNDRTYTDLANFIKNNTPAIPTCGALDQWKEGYPRSDGDCIMTGPGSNYTLVDTTCNTLNNPGKGKVGFICWENQRKIQK